MPLPVYASLPVGAPVLSLCERSQRQDLPSLQKTSRQSVQLAPRYHAFAWYSPGTHLTGPHNRQHCRSSARIRSHRLPKATASSRPWRRRHTPDSLALTTPPQRTPKLASASPGSLVSLKLVLWRRAYGSPAERRRAASELLHSSCRSGYQGRQGCHLLVCSWHNPCRPAACLPLSCTRLCGCLPGPLPVRWAVCRWDVGLTAASACFGLGVPLVARPSQLPGKKRGGMTIPLQGMSAHNLQASQFWGPLLLLGGHAM
jgi:hypothetical protein